MIITTNLSFKNFMLPTLKFTSGSMVFSSLMLILKEKTEQKTAVLLVYK